MSRQRSFATARSSLLSLLFVLSILSGTAAAQETRATITGTVKDAQGAVVPGVTVSVLHLPTNVATDAVTNDQGVFTVQKLAPGPVKVTATLPGFKTFVREGITLRTAETVTISVTLEIGGVEEQVSVNAQSSQIESN